MNLRERWRGRRRDRGRKGKREEDRKDLNLSIQPALAYNVLEDMSMDPEHSLDFVNTFMPWRNSSCAIMSGR